MHRARTVKDIGAMTMDIVLETLLLTWNWHLPTWWRDININMLHIASEHLGNVEEFSYKVSI